jgi:hypothetical protein
VSDDSEAQDSVEDKPARQELPSWNRSRSKKKRGKEGNEDAFQRGVKRAGRAALSKSYMVLGGLALGAGAIALGVYLWGAGVEGAADGTRVLGQATAYEHRAMTGDIETIMAGLERQPPNPIIKDEEEREAAIQAALEDLAALQHDDTDRLGDLLRAARSLRSGDHATALSLYDAFIQQTPADHPAGFLAREGRGAALEAGGDLEGALVAYEGIATEAGQFYRDMSLYHQGRILERLERNDEAVARYKQYIEEFPLTEGSLAREQVKNRMLELDPVGLSSLGPTGPEAGIEIVDQ